MCATPFSLSADKNDIAGKQVEINQRLDEAVCPAGDCVRVGCFIPLPIDVASRRPRCQHCSLRGRANLSKSTTPGRRPESTNWRRAEFAQYKRRCIQNSASTRRLDYVQRISVNPFHYYYYYGHLYSASSQGPQMRYVGRDGCMVS